MMYTHQTFVNLFEGPRCAGPVAKSSCEDSVTYSTGWSSSGTRLAAWTLAWLGSSASSPRHPWVGRALLKRYQNLLHPNVETVDRCWSFRSGARKGRICSATHRVTLPRRLIIAIGRDSGTTIRGGTAGVVAAELEHVDLSAAFPPTKRAVLASVRDCFIAAALAASVLSRQNTARPIQWFAVAAQPRSTAGTRQAPSTSPVKDTAVALGVSVC